MSPTLITIMTFTDSHEAAVVRSFLESEEIFTVLQGEYSAQIYPYSSNQGHVQLQVNENDLESAIQLLKKGGYWKDESKQSGFYLKLYAFLKKLHLVN